MAKTSTERNLKYISNQKKKGMSEWRVWVTKDEKTKLKTKLKEIRGTK
jgi:hypothetical protein